MFKLSHQAVDYKNLKRMAQGTLLTLLFSTVAQAQIGITTPTVTSGELIRASDWNKVKLDLETIAAAVGSLQNQSWDSSGADTFYDAGNVGIGLNSPTGMLHLFADTPAANAVLLQLGTSDDADRVRIDEDGDMTIDGKLVVRDSDIYETVGDLELSGEDSLYLSLDWNNNDGDTQNIFFGKNSDGAGPNFVELMRLTEAGLLGIGISNPQSQIHIAGAIQIGGDPAPCVATKEGALRYASGAVERCNGADWDALATTNVSDNLGSHIAEQNIDLDTFRIVGEGGSEGIGIDANGDVGIGTDNPTTILDITNDNTPIVTVRSRAADNNDAALVLTGAQTTNITADVASLRLRNKDGAPFEGARIALRNGDNTDSTAMGDLVFMTNTGTGDNLSEKMRILDSGAVGIGTSDPVAQLQVIKNGVTPNEIVFQVGTNNDINRFAVDEDGDVFSDGNIYPEGGNVLTGEGALAISAEDSLYLAMDWKSNDADSRALIVGKNGVGGAGGFEELMRLNENGRFGLNNNIPANRMHVVEDNAGDRIAVFENLATSGSPEGLLVLTGQGAGPAPNFAVGTGNAGTHTKKFVVTNSGRVGVGNINPLSMLSTVGGATEWNMTLDNTEAGANNWFIGSTANDWASGGGKLLFSSDNASTSAELTLDSDTGNVGVSMTAPPQKLSVDGNVWLTNDDRIMFESTSGIAGQKDLYVSGNDAFFTDVHFIAGYSIGLRNKRGNLLGIESNGTDLNFAAGDAQRMTLSGSGELEVESISSDGTGKVVCIKSDGNLGTCTDAPNGSGVCSCS